MAIHHGLIRPQAGKQVRFALSNEVDKFHHVELDRLRRRYAGVLVVRGFRKEGQFYRVTLLLDGKEIRWKRGDDVPETLIGEPREFIWGYFRPVAA